MSHSFEPEPDVRAQAIRFCTSFDGTRLAYAVTGEGTPLVKAPHWLTHLEYEYRSPIWRPWIEALSRGHRLLRMDERACGLSDWDVSEFSFEAYVRDLEAVIDAAGYGRFALFGHSQGAAIAIEYAARHPERVTHLVLLGGYARGAMRRNPSPEQVAELEALVQLARSTWGREDRAYHEMWAMMFMPSANLEQIGSFSALQRASSSPRNAPRIIESFWEIDVREAASRIRCPTLLLHARHDRRVPFEEGRLLAGLIPGARFVPLETADHILPPQDARFEAFFAELRAFLPGARDDAARSAFSSLTAREAQVLERIAQGLDNAQIAAHLEVSEKTVRNNITRIFDKLGVESRAQAIVLARDHGLGRG